MTQLFAAIRFLFSKKFFDRLNNWIEETESSIVNVLSALAPWLAPAAPAYMTYQHASGEYLKFPPYVAWPVALVVEILGFSAVSTFLKLWFYNRRTKDQVKKAPTVMVVVAFGFYLSLILVSNVLLDYFKNDEIALIVVRALYTLQTIPAALIVAARTQHRDMVEQAAVETVQSLEDDRQAKAETKEQEDRKLESQRLAVALAEAEAEKARAEAVTSRTNLKQSQIDNGTSVNKRTHPVRKQTVKRTNGRTNERANREQTIVELLDMYETNEQRTLGVSELARLLAANEHPEFEDSQVEDFVRQTKGYISQVRRKWLDGR